MGRGTPGSTRTDIWTREHSASLPACYDREKLTTLVGGYYTGEEHKAAAVDWWLAFEAWRASLQKTNL